MAVGKNGNIQGSIGGGEIEKYCIEKAKEVFKTKDKFMLDFDLSPKANGPVSMDCGGKLSIEFEYVDSINVIEKEIVSPLCVYIFGAGHVAFELCPVLEHLGFDVIIYDERKDFATKKRFPSAKDIICKSYKDIEKYIKINPNDYIVVCTPDHIYDIEVLEQILKFKCKYVGCIGSKNKAHGTRVYLEENGFSKEAVNSIHSPIGLELYGDTPEEIAISIAAEITLVKNQKNSN